MDSLSQKNTLLRTPSRFNGEHRENHERNPNLLYPDMFTWDYWDVSNTIPLESSSIRSDICRGSGQEFVSRSTSNTTLTSPQPWKNIDQQSSYETDEMNTSINFDCSGENEIKSENVNTTHYGSINRNNREIPRISVKPASPDPNDLSPIAEKMRRRLQFFYMNPLEKWRVSQRFPYKFATQLIKIIFVTVQLCLFATNRYANVNYNSDTKISFAHLFLKDWEGQGGEASTPLAVYTKDNFYSILDFAVNSYDKVEFQSIGSYFHSNGNNSLVQFCIEKYVNAIVFKHQESYKFNNEIEKKCMDIKNTGNFSSESFFESQNFSVSFDSLLEAHLLFKLKTVRFMNLDPLNSVDCYVFDIDLSFNNRDRHGQVHVELEAIPTRLRCQGDVEWVDHNEIERIGHYGVNYIVIGLCTLSLVLCCRAIYRAQKLKREAVAFFKQYYQRDLSFHDRLDFLNFWYLLIIVNDVLIICGSTLKEEIEKEELTGEVWNVCSVLLGVGNLLVWFGVLRYLGFFRTYNILILTLKRATPNILRFLICAILVFAGFTFCGWLVLGPYHPKFSTLFTSSECLFSLINGDEMFETFDFMSSKSALLWWFSRIYLYTFISLFIYVVLSLFIALIMDAYDTIKMHYMEGFPRSILEEFIGGSDITMRHISSEWSMPDLQKLGSLSRCASRGSESSRGLSFSF